MRVYSVLFPACFSQASDNNQTSPFWNLGVLEVLREVLAISVHFQIFVESYPRTQTNLEDVDNTTFAGQPTKSGVMWAWSTSQRHAQKVLLLKSSAWILWSSRKCWGGKVVRKLARPKISKLLCKAHRCVNYLDWGSVWTIYRGLGERTGSRPHWTSGQFRVESEHQEASSFRTTEASLFNVLPVVRLWCLDVLPFALTRSSDSLNLDPWQEYFPKER